MQPQLLKSTLDATSKLSGKLAQIDEIAFVSAG
jgi:hypothetical protein